MMLPLLPDRRVCQIHLTAPSQELVRRGAILLEDALHTASLPQSQGSRVLVVRSLNLGVIHSQQSSATLALTVEARLRQLESSAISAEDSAADDYPAVYFRDEVEPYLCLAKKLSRGEPTTAWFWPLAVPGWHPHFSTNEGLRHILYGMVQTKTGVGGLLVLIQLLREERGLERLFTVLGVQDGPALLQLCHWVAPMSVALTSSPPISVSGEWATILDCWLQTWGTHDSRSLWLSTIVLAMENPARLLEQGLTEQAYQIIQQITLREMNEGEAVFSETADTGNLPLQAVHSPSISSSSTPHPVQLPTSTPAQISDFGEPIHQSEINQNSQAADIERAPDSPAETGNFEQPFLNSRNSLSFESPQFSQYAGFYFLIPLMQALGMASFLETHVPLIDLEFPKRLLRAIARRLAIPGSDPIWVSLSLSTLSFQYSTCLNFMAPQIWQRGIVNPGSTFLVSMNQRQVLLDHSGRLPLSVWRDAAPESAQAWFELPFLPVNSHPVPDSDLELISNAWITAIRRWCRRYAQMGLHTLICRPGRIALTRTHLDILIHHQQADIRIRRVGLDIDPGWVPWFGRVVSFHYLYGEPTS